MAKIIGRITLQPKTVRPGEPVRIEVFINKQNNPLNVSQAQVSINGVLGAIQFLQFPTVGKRQLVIRARATNGQTDRKVVNLNVTGVPLNFPSFKNNSDIAMIGVSQLRQRSPTLPSSR